MAELYANNAHGVLSASITAGATSLTLVSGGHLFPSVLSGSGDFFRAVIEPSSSLDIREIIFCTSRSLDTFLIIERGTESTTALTWSAGDRVRLEPTSGTFEALLSASFASEEESFFHAWAGMGAQAGAQDEFGALDVGQGTRSRGVITNASHRASRCRQTMAQSNTTTTSGMRSANEGRVWLGNAAGRGGFDLEWDIGIEVGGVSDARCFTGIQEQNAGFIVDNGTPSTRSAEEMIGCGWDSGTISGNWQIFHNNGTGPVTVVDTGIAKDTTSIFRLRLFAPPNASTVNVTFTNTTTGAVFTHTISTNLPANTTLLNPNHASVKSPTVIGSSMAFYDYWWRVP